MSDFSGRTPQKLDTPVANNGFFPDLNLGELQEQEVTPSHRQLFMLDHLENARVEVNRLLHDYWCLWARCGKETLADVPSDTPDELTNLYKRAVYARAKAKLVRHSPSINRRDRQGATPETEESEAAFLDASNDAIRLILGEKPTLGIRVSVI